MAVAVDEGPVYGSLFTITPIEPEIPFDLPKLAHIPFDTVESIVLISSDPLLDGTHYDDFPVAGSALVDPLLDTVFPIDYPIDVQLE